MLHRPALIPLLLVWPVLGCVATSPGPRQETTRSEPSYEVRTVALQRGFLRVELKIPRLPSGPKPVILVPLADEERLLSQGAIVVAFEHDWSVVPSLQHEAGGDTATPPTNQVGRWLLAAPRPGIVGRAYFQLINLSADQSIPAIVDFLETLPEIDPERIGIGGSSTAGFVALEALAAEPRLAAGVVQSACGDYHTFLRASSLGLENDPRWLPGGELILDDDYEAELSNIEPIHRTDRYPPRPLLMLNGTADSAIPFACAARTAKRLHGAYARAGVPERFRFVVYQDAGHDLGEPAKELALRFWERWLLGGDKHY